MTDYIILMPLLILIFGLTPIVARDSYLNKNQKNIMLWIIGLIGVLIAQNVVCRISERWRASWATPSDRSLSYCSASW